MNLLRNQLLQIFNQNYSSNANNNKFDEILNSYEANPQMVSFLKEMIQKRNIDPFIGSKIAGEEIYINLIEILKNENGVHAETLLAILGTLGGNECVSGVMSTFDSIISDTVNDKNEEKAIAELLDIIIVETKSEETFIVGNRIGNTFLSFYYTVADDSTIDVNTLTDLSLTVTLQMGTADYWKTSFNEYIPESPKELFEAFEGKFEQSLKRYCFSQQERMLAFAIAAQKAVQQSEQIMTKQKALAIVADFGWRMSHYLTRKGENNVI